VLPNDAVLILTLIILLPIASAILLFFAAVHAVARKRGHVPAGRRSWLERRWILRPVAGFLIIYLLCLAWAIWVEPQWVQVTTTEIKVDQPVLGYDRFRIVHLSDFHLEQMGAREERVARRVAEAQPHLILLTGDYMNVRDAGDDLIQMLRLLQAPHGVFGVPGNWDAKWITRELFRRGGAELLEDETRVLEREGRKLRLAGHSAYPNRPLRELLAGLEDGAATIYLQHAPDAVDELRARDASQRVDLFLCGHTHGGQVGLPFWGAVVTMSKYHKRYERGLYDVDGVPMYVNRGVGMMGGAVPRVRFLSRPEVAVIDLVYKK
jgi:hypothetical protein